MKRGKAIGPCTPAPRGPARPSRGLLAGALLLSLLAACRDAPSTMVVFSRDDPWSFAQADMAKAGLPVVIRGRIGNGSDGQFEAAVVDAIRRAMTWTAKPDVRWVKRAPPQSVRIIVGFGGSAGGPGACADETDGASAPAETVATLTMLLCAGDERIAEVAGRFGRPARADEPRFAALIRQATSDLFAR
ncbi:MAG: hypothetical protein MUE49_03055 [Rhodospirillales bacterium]|nr:hypothetical protein [Rhodospirillales bacterium]